MLIGDDHVTIEVLYRFSSSCFTRKNVLKIMQEIVQRKLFSITASDLKVYVIKGIDIWNERFSLYHDALEYYEEKSRTIYS